MLTCHSVQTEMEELLDDVLADFGETAGAKVSTAHYDQQPPVTAIAASVTQPLSAHAQVTAQGAGTSSHVGTSASPTAAAITSGPKGLGGLSLDSKARKAKAQPKADAPAPSSMPPEAQRLAEDILTLFAESKFTHFEDGEPVGASSSDQGLPDFSAMASQLGADPETLRMFANTAQQAASGDPDAAAAGAAASGGIHPQLQALLSGWLGDAGAADAEGTMPVTHGSGAEPSTSSRGGASHQNFTSATLQGLFAQTQEAVKTSAKHTRGQAAAESAASSSGRAGPAAGGGGGLFGGLLSGLTALQGGGGEGAPPGMNMMLDYIMHNLLSKDILYGPLKEIRDRYPPWLVEHETSLSAEELARYKAQFASMQCVCEQYENAPDDFEKLMGLIQEMQAHGDPPPDIVEEMTGLPGGASAAGLGLGAGLGAGSDRTVPEGLGEVPPGLEELTQDLEQNCKMQ